MMLYIIYLLSIVACGLIYHFLERARTKTTHQAIIQRDGCQPLRLLPNKLYPPFGLDKLQKVTEAEKTKTYPLLMLGDHEKYGDTYAQWGGPMYTVITRDTDNIRAVLSKQFKSFEVGDGRHGCVRPLLGGGIFTQDGPKWHASRKLLAPMIQRPTLPDLDLIERHFERLQVAIKPGIAIDSASTSRTVDFKAPLLDLSLELTTEFLLGEDTESVSTNSRSLKWADRFATEFNTAFKWISKRERLKGFYWLIDGFEFRRSCRNAQRLVDDVIKQSMKLHGKDKSGAESYVALESLLREEQDPKSTRDQFMSLLLAGRDTSGALLCWIFYSLAREPDLLTSLRKEIIDTLGSDILRKPTKADLNAMTKLDQFLCETLRLFPPIPLNCRFSTQATSLPRGGGENGEAPILIPNGTLIAFSTFAVQRNRDLYGDDASEFRVERWSDDQSKEQRMVDWSFHPFLGGPRKCLGERFAVTQAKYLTCRILQHYKEIIPTDEVGKRLTIGSAGTWVDEVKYDVGLTMMPDAGVWLRLVPAT